MRIALAARNASGWTGTANTLWEHARRLSAAGHETWIVAERVDAGRFRAAGVRIRRLCRWPWGGGFRRRLFAWRAGRFFRRRRFDMVHGHGDTLVQDVLSLHNCVHEAHERVRGTPLPGDSAVGRMHERQLRERRFRILVANSALMKDDVVRRFGLPPECVRVIHPGHDPQRFRPLPGDPARAGDRRRWGAGPDDFVVGLITSGDFRKRGVGLFLEAVSRLPPATRRKTRAVVIGKTLRTAAYAREAEGLGLGDRLVFDPGGPEPERFYRALDLYVHPALFEEFGQSVQEAMACGVAVLTTRRVGAAELWPAAEARWLRDAPDPAAMAGDMDRLLNDAPSRRRLGEALAGAVRENTWDRNFERTWACYEEALGKNKP